MEDFLYSGGHTWVCDGYKKEERKCTLVRIVTTESGLQKVEEIPLASDFRTLLHCNWGWGKDDAFNGYYYSGVFDTAHPVYGSSVKDGSCYRYELKNILDIHR